MDIAFFKNKCVLVMGLGQFGGGLDCAVFAAKTAAKVIVTDLAPEAKLTDPLTRLSEFNNIEYHLGEHIPADFTADYVDIVIVNPAVSPDNRFVAMAQDANKMITSQIELFLQLCPAKIIGVTGSNGKSTTAALTHHLLSEARGQKGTTYANVWLSGNIGDRPLLSILPRINPDDIAVLEISSFQAEQLSRIRKAPHVSLITNLTPNHLNRHQTFQAYCAAKEALFIHQRPDKNDPPVSIFNAEDPVTAQWHQRYSKEPGRITLAFRPEDVPEKIARRFTLAGRMNLSNLAAAMTVARLFGVNDDSIAKAAANFTALADRLELIADIDGVRWYNDSIATTPDSTIAAIDAFAEPKILIAGGYDKGLPFAELASRIAANTKAAILIGDTAEKIAQAISANRRVNCRVERAGSMAEAVTIAEDMAQAGDIVLLSPACASYDMFDNYRQRAKTFKNLVLNKKNTKP